MAFFPCYPLPRHHSTSPPFLTPHRHPFFWTDLCGVRQHYRYSCLQTPILGVTHTPQQTAVTSPFFFFRPRHSTLLSILYPRCSTRIITIVGLWSFFSFLFLLGFWYPTSLSIPYHTPTSRMPHFSMLTRIIITTTVGNWTLASSCTAFALRSMSR
jgi:hypothetical protein